MQCQAEYDGEQCENDAATDPEMPAMLFGTVCNFHWYVWKWENEGRVSIPSHYDFDLEDVKAEAEADNQ